MQLVTGRRRRGWGRGRMTREWLLSREGQMLQTRGSGARTFSIVQEIPLRRSEPRIRIKLRGHFPS